MLRPLESIWSPQAKQALFLGCPAYEVMYGGAKGGGKTDALLFDHVGQHSIGHQHWERTGIKTKGLALILRKEFGRLKDFMNRAQTYFPLLSGGQMTWRERDYTWYCTCGYRVWFGHCEGPNDHQLYQGQEISRLGIDQVEEIPWNQYSYIKLQVRASKKDAVAGTEAIRMSANPLGRYADWVKKRFVEPDRNGFKFITESMDVDGVTVTRDRVFIPATVRDNKYLGPEYIAELMSAPEHMRRAFLDGDWDVTPGSFFGEVFDQKVHVIDDLGPTLIRVPPNWPVWRWADWGSRAPACTLWGTADNDGLLIVLDELYGPGIEPISWGKKIMTVEEKWGWVEPFTFPARSKLTGVLDPAACRQDVSGGPSISEKLFESGLSFYEGDNERKAGWVEVRRRLTERGGVSGKIPGLRICRRCTNLIRTLPNLTAPEAGDGDQDDIDTKQEDHAADALRYGVMSRPRSRLEADVKEDEIRRWERIYLGRQTHGDSGARNHTTGY